MIRSLFLPEVIGNGYYLFEHSIAACEITQSVVRIALVKAQGIKRTLETVVEVPLPQEGGSQAERATKALTQALSTLKKWDEFYVVLPTNFAFIKELTFPFASLEKIKLTLPFELEPLLPFPVGQASVDGLVTRTYEDKASVLAVAVRNDLLADQLSMYQNAGIEPTRVTLDVIELYTIYKALGLHKTAPNALLLYIGNTTMRIGAVVNEALKGARLINEGLSKLARAYDADLDQFMHTRLSAHDVPKSVLGFFTDLRFTLQAFQAYLPEGMAFETSFLMGAAADIAGLPEVIERVIGIPCKTITTSLIIQNGIADLKGNHGIPNRAIIVVSSALALPGSARFNLYGGHELALEDVRMNRQFIAILAGIALLVITVLANGFLTTRRFGQAIKGAEQEAVVKLKKAFPAMATRVKSNALDVVVKAAQTEVARERAIWFALSTQNRASFLHYLQELSTRLDPDGLGLILDRLTLTEDSLDLEGQVRDYEALKKLEEDLRRSQLFTVVPRLQELKFSVKLPLDKKVGDSS